MSKTIESQKKAWKDKVKIKEKNLYDIYKRYHAKKDKTFKDSLDPFQWLRVKTKLKFFKY